MSPGTGELIDRIQPERVSRLGRQIATVDVPYQGQGQGQVRSPKSPKSGHHKLLVQLGMCSILFIGHFIHRIQK